MLSFLFSQESTHSIILINTVKIITTYLINIHKSKFCLEHGNKANVFLKNFTLIQQRTVKEKKMYVYSFKL